MPLWKRLAKKAGVLLLSLFILTYLIVLIANDQGFLDSILTFQIRNEVEEEYLEDADFLALPPEAQERLVEEEVQRRVEGQGLNQPLLIKAFTQTLQALTFSLGEAYRLTTAGGSTHPPDFVAEYAPRTLLLLTTASLTSALLGIWVGLRLAKRARWRRRRDWPLLSLTLIVVPSWMLAMFLLWILAYQLRLLPPGGFVSTPPPTDPLLYVWDVARHLALPLLTVAVTSIGFWVFTTRNVVVKAMHEGAARAEEVGETPDRETLYREARRAAYPRVVAYSALPLLALFQGAMFTEFILAWPGLGLLLVVAVRLFDLVVLIASTVAYAMLFVMTIFALELTRELLEARNTRQDVASSLQAPSDNHDLGPSVAHPSDEAKDK